MIQEVGLGLRMAINEYPKLLFPTHIIFEDIRNFDFELNAIKKTTLLQVVSHNLINFHYERSL